MQHGSRRLWVAGLRSKLATCNLQRETEFKFSGDYSGEATPVTIPNTAVKLSRADGTAREIVWESRSLPGFKLKRKSQGERFPWLFLFN